VLHTCEARAQNYHGTLWTLKASPASDFGKTGGPKLPIADPKVVCIGDRQSKQIGPLRQQARGSKRKLILRAYLPSLENTLTSYIAEHQDVLKVSI
jgi:hypothetical protein